MGPGRAVGIRSSLGGGGGAGGSFGTRERGQGERRSGLYGTGDAGGQMSGRCSLCQRARPQLSGSQELHVCTKLRELRAQLVRGFLMRAVHAKGRV